LIFKNLLFYGILYGAFTVPLRFRKSFDFQRFSSITQTLDFQRFYGGFTVRGGWVLSKVDKQGLGLS
jgi:hypothetical protein